MTQYLSFEDKLDEFEQFSLPPDPPKNLDLVNQIHELAANHSNVRQLLSKLPLVSHPDAQHRKFTETNAKLEKAIIKSRERPSEESRASDKETPSQSTEKSYVLSTKRDRLLRQLEHTQHERLLTTAFSNYLKYHEDRRTAFKDAITDSNHIQDAALHECEEMLAAARFDAASGRAIDLERLAKYRNSIRKSIHETSKRNTSLLTEAIPQDEKDFTSELQRARTKVRAKALEYSEEAGKIRERTAEHQATNGPAQIHGRAEGLAAAQMKLLLLLDNLVPESDTPEELIGTTKARTPDISAKLQRAQEAIAHLDAVRSTVLSELDQRRAIPKKSPMHVQKLQERLKLAASPRELLVSLACQRKPLTTSTEVQTLASQIRNLEIQIENDELRGHLTEFRALSSTSSEMYADLVTRRTHETPLLADIALHDGIEPLESAKLWTAESLRRTKLKEAQHEEWLDKIRNRIDHSHELIETGNALVKEYNTAKTTHSLAKVMHRA